MNALRGLALLLLFQAIGDAGIALGLQVLLAALLIPLAFRLFG